MAPPVPPKPTRLSSSSSSGSVFQTVDPLTTPDGTFLEPGTFFFLPTTTSAQDDVTISLPPPYPASLTLSSTLLASSSYASVDVDAVCRDAIRRGHLPPTHSFLLPYLSFSLDATGASTLHYAMKHPMIVQVLLPFVKEGDVGIRTKQGKSCLHYARGSSVEVLEGVFDLERLKRVRDNDGKLPWECVRDDGDVECAASLMPLEMAHNQEDENVEDDSD